MFDISVGDIVVYDDCDYIVSTVWDTGWMEIEDSISNNTIDVFITDLDFPEFESLDDEDDVYHPATMSDLFLSLSDIIER